VQEIIVVIMGNVSPKKRRSRWTRAWIAWRQTLGFSATLIQQLANENYCAEFRAIFRMDMVSSEKFLGMVALAPQIYKKDTQMRMSISA